MATIGDIATTMKSATLPPLPEKASWLAQRAASALAFADGQHGMGPPPSPAGRRASPTGKKASRKNLNARVPRQVPQLPESYSPREELFEDIVSRLTTKDGEDAIGGKGGRLRQDILAAAVATAPRVLSHFDVIAWVAFGQRPSLTELQRVVLTQLGGTAPAEADEAQLLEALHAAAADRRVLLVIDDAWHLDHERALYCLDETTRSACLLTTRISGLVKGFHELELQQLDREEALALLLRAGEVDLDACAEPTVAREAAYSAVELCGRLPLCLAIAGAMILEHADDWDTWLVPALRDSHGAELRERSAAAMGGADAEGGALSVEERVLRASLRSIKDEERVGVTALFDVCACFAEDVTVPAAVFDALAPAILEEATRTEREIKEGTRKSLDGPWGEKPKPLAKSRSQISDVRRWLREALRHSLLIGSMPMAYVCMISCATIHSPARRAVMLVGYVGSS